MSTIIVHANLHPVGYIYHDLSNTRSLPKDKMKKGKVKITLTLVKDIKYKIGPSQREAGICRGARARF